MQERKRRAQGVRERRWDAPGEMRRRAFMMRSSSESFTTRRFTEVYFVCPRRCTLRKGGRVRGGGKRGSPRPSASPPLPPVRAQRQIRAIRHGPGRWAESNHPVGLGFSHCDSFYGSAHRPMACSSRAGLKQGSSRMTCEAACVEKALFSSQLAV